MLTGLRHRLLPPHQRRTLEELSEDLEIGSGDALAKKSAFWTMLVLSAIIASAGVLGDSTATVIGAMIIAPLSTPIMGIALAAVKRRSNGSVGFVFFGVLVVVGIGVAFSWTLPSTYELLDNSQISSRVSPNLIDLTAALATGLAGAVALARRDVAAVLPGVAIAISLVPPLAVVGVCLGRGAIALALGALVLFLSNLLALVLAGVLVFTVLGYTSEASESAGRAPRRTYVTLAVLVSLVIIPLVGNSVGAYLLTVWTARVQSSAEAWLSGVPEASVTDVTVQSQTFVVQVQTPGEVPPVQELVDALDGEVPHGFELVVQTNLGQQFQGGTIGG
jgi:uncharacterized hydrophobic protein (TIGR00271 family)